MTAAGLRKMIQGIHTTVNINKHVILSPHNILASFNKQHHENYVSLCSLVTPSTRAADDLGKLKIFTQLNINYIIAATS